MFVSDKTLINMSYAENTRLLLDKIKDVSADALGEYAIIVHGIKGASLGICAESVGSDAKTLEDAAKSGNYDFASSRNPFFLETVARLIQILKTRAQKPVLYKSQSKISLTRLCLTVF